jgi:SAM-dependent methyltransferase
VRRPSPAAKPSPPALGPIEPRSVQVERGSLRGMNGLPDDTAARQEFLQDWAAEQEQQRQIKQFPGRLPLRTRLAVARIQRADRFQRIATRVLDRGLETAGWAGEPEHEHPDRVHYVPSAWHVLPRALRYIGVSDGDVFVDFGCGKGRVVHQAARRPFRRVVGVEISPVLAEAARSALAARRHQHRCREVEIVVADVTAFRVPDDLTVGYFYRPFTGETFEAVLRGIVDSIDRNPRRVRLIYVWPTDQERSQILATGRFRLLKEQRSRLLDTATHNSHATIFESR